MLGRLIPKTEAQIEQEVLDVLSSGDIISGDSDNDITQGTDGKLYYEDGHVLFQTLTPLP